MPPPGRRKVRYSISRPAVQPPNSAVSVTYILSRAAAVNARSAPPGSEELLGKQIISVLRKRDGRNSDVRVRDYATDHMEDICGLPSFDAHRHGDLKTQSPAVDI